MRDFRLELLFANQDALVDYLGIPPGIQSLFLPAVGESRRDAAAKQHQLKDHLTESLDSNPVSELQRIILAGPPLPGQVVCLEQAFYFKKGKASERLRINAKLDTDESWSVEASIDKSRVPFETTLELFSRRFRVFMIASVQSVDEKKILLRPFFIGQRILGGAPFVYSDVSARRVFPQMIDAFSSVDWERGATKIETDKVALMLESDVKKQLSRILGDSFIDSDWGGERSDISLNTIMVSGRQTSSAWLLKGRSVKGTMHIKDLGKNGDQIERLTTEDAELLVIQSNAKIGADVVNLARAFAFDMRSPRRYMILDGNATAQVLRDLDGL